MLGHCTSLNRHVKLLHNQISNYIHYCGFDFTCDAFHLRLLVLVLTGLSFCRPDLHPSRDFQWHKSAAFYGHKFTGLVWFVEVVVFVCCVK